MILWFSFVLYLFNKDQQTCMDLCMWDCTLSSWCHSWHLWILSSVQYFCLTCLLSASFLSAEVFCRCKRRVCQVYCWILLSLGQWYVVNGLQKLMGRDRGALKATVTWLQQPQIAVCNKTFHYYSVLKQLKLSVLPNVCRNNSPTLQLCLPSGVYGLWFECWYFNIYSSWE